jgi:hypothetical protein
MTGTVEEQVVYFADWNPDKLEGDVLPLTKVGISSDPQRRMGQLTTPPFEPKIVATVETKGDVEVAESTFHLVFDDLGYHVNGEWFNLPSNVIEWVEERQVTSKDEILSEWSSVDVT